MKDFVHLHVHTQFSLLDSTIRANRLVALTKIYGMKACAITDHGSMHSVVEFWNEAIEAGIKPIIGCEVYLEPQSRFCRKEADGEGARYHLVLFAMNEKGYRNLMNSPI
jgi:DNA polymerase III subunit alpha